MGKNNKYWIWFSRINCLSNTQKQGLLEKYNSPEKIMNLSADELKLINYIDDKCVTEILNKKYKMNLEEYEDYMAKNDINVITVLDKEYPDKLKNIYDKPTILFVKGNIELLNKKSVAIVGCRDCSEYGKKVSHNLAYNLAQQNICIISGLAKGIDMYSHIGALESNGGTIAVVGNGLDNVYPYENKRLYERIIEKNGLIVTEYVIGTKPNKINFPARNRIISALSDAIVVVEAKEKSGSLITADFGLEHGKEVLAVPGNIYSKNSIGTNDLIKQGACPVTCYRDVLELIK